VLPINASIDEFRIQLRTWLERNKRSALDSIGEYELEGEAWRNPKSYLFADYSAFEIASLNAGLVCPHWPVEYGGLGLDELQMAVLAEEFSFARMPRITRGMGERLAGPAILAHGTTKQKAHFLPKIVSGENRYCQGFSEPSAGSDLASLRTRGEIIGDEIVISGQKIWTSRGHLADMMFILCRTNPDAPKHKGISYVLVPMKNNGITVRPIKTMSGDQAFCEEFIDGARAPLFNVIGGLNNGWKSAMTTLGSERGAVAAVQHLISLARERGKNTDPLVRQRLAWAFCQIHVMKATGQRMLATIASGGKIGPEASLTKLVWSEYHRRFGEIAIDLEGSEALTRPLGEGYKVGRWQEAFLSSRAETIFAGTSEVQRRIIAEQVLGLPR
jgi:alkylation response protein AidB-like acyl-CoA dehydrogenase